MTAFLKTKDILKLAGMSRSALYFIMSENSPGFDPNFPQPVRIAGPKSKQAMLRWSKRDVDLWLQTMGAKLPEDNELTDAKREIERLQDNVLRVNSFFDTGAPITGREELKDLARSIIAQRKWFND